MMKINWQEARNLLGKIKNFGESFGINFGEITIAPSWL